MSARACPLTMRYTRVWRAEARWFPALGRYARAILPSARSAASAVPAWLPSELTVFAGFVAGARMAPAFFFLGSANAASGRLPLAREPVRCPDQAEHASVRKAISTLMNTGMEHDTGRLA